jgi:hypothetical protein
MLQRWIKTVSVLLLLLTPFAIAQTFRGGINGTVVDNSGASVPHAAVKLTNVATGVVSSTVSSSGGEFLFQDLPLGMYTVEVSSSGFSTIKYDKIQVSAGTIYTLPVRLAVASESTTVEVSAASIALDTTTVTQTTVLDAKSVDNIPLNGRDFTQLVQLTPGFAGYVGGGFGSLNGTRANQMNWQIDGVDNNDLWHNIPAVNQGGVSGIAGIVLPIDAVEQFSAQTQAGPEGGRNPGGTINLALKAGTNQLHGSIYYFNRNELFGTKSPFADVKQKVRNYNTGFSVGGPFLKDRLFGFLTFEHQRFVIGESGLATEPNVGYQAQAVALLNSVGLTPLPVMQSVLNTLWAGGNLASNNANPNNFHSPVPEFGYSWNGLGKIDWHISDKDSLSAHWFTGQGNQVAPLTPNYLPDFYEVAPLHVHNIAIVYNRSITSHISNQLLMGVNYFNQVFNDANTNFSSLATQGFITGAPYANAPNMVVGSFDSPGQTPPEGRNDITGHITDQVSWVIGNHELRFGGEYRQAQLDEFYKRHVVGAFTFDGSQVAAAKNAQTPGCSSTPQTATNCYSPDQYVAPLADFLSGRTSDASIAIGDPERQVFVNTWFVSAGDSWKVTPKLVVNYGARLDYEGPLHNSNKDLSVFRPNVPGGIAFQGNQIANLAQQYYSAFSPRVGLDYSVSPNTVVRAGYGFYFDTPNLNPFLDNRPGNSAPNGVEGNPAGPNPVFTIDVGEVQIAPNQTIFPTGSGVSCTVAAPCGVFSINQNFRPSYNMNYSFNVEQTLASGVIAQIGYVGSQARHLLALLDINQALPGIYADTVDPVTGNVLVSANAKRQATRPYFSTFANFGNINEVQSIGTSNYNSLQTQLRVQSWHHLTVSGTYTWSHNLDETSQYRGELPQDSRNFKGQYGNSDFDVRNTFVMFASYEIPGSHHLKALTSGWQANVLASYHGGQPFNIFASGDVSGTNEGTDRAVQVLANPYAGFRQRTVNASWLNPAAFADPAPGTFGTVRRNQFYSPGYGDMDLSFFKNTRIKERVNIQFRAEMFNLGNRINFAPPSSANSGGTFTLSDTIGDYNGAPGIGAGEPFNTQFGAKITF